MVNKILDELPPQPWGKNVHQHVSQKLGLEDITVSNAIAYLVYTEKVYAQVYGYVFDRDNRIVLEGEHYGHTEEEARKTLETQRTIHEKKFRF